MYAFGVDLRRLVDAPAGSAGWDRRSGPTGSGRMWWSAVAARGACRAVTLMDGHPLNGGRRVLGH